MPNCYLGELRTLSDTIWNNPELGLKEKLAHNAITNFFKKVQIGDVTTSYLLDTAFKVEYVTKSGLKNPDSLKCVAFFSEYDALPGIGHACGHNLIAVVGISAFLKLVSSLEAQSVAAKVILLGSPAEESDGGKIMMMEKGALEGIDFALMAHPAAINAVDVVTLAITTINAIFHGKSAHGVVPWEGRNALDAAVLAYNNINSMRHRMRPSWRAHGIFVDGGKAPNVIPDRAELSFYLRAPDKTQLNILIEMGKECFKSGASATGCTVEFQYGHSYDSVIQNPVLGNLYTKYMKECGRVFPPDGERPFRGSTDMGDISRKIPSLHPWFSVPCNGAVGHTVEFREAVKTTESFNSAMEVADGLAKTAFDVLTNEELFHKMKNTFSK